MKGIKSKKNVTIITGHTHKTSEMNICHKIYIRFRLWQDKLKIWTAVYIKEQLHEEMSNGWFLYSHLLSKEVQIISKGTFGVETT